jgi:hypothetical protein
MFSYEVETLLTATMQDQLNARALAGWRLVAVVPHPYDTVAAAPVYLAFFERPA